MNERMNECVIRTGGYKKQSVKSGCCISDGVFHERCVGSVDLAGCKAACDAERACKGYVQVLWRRGPCQIATTSECPRGFVKDSKTSLGKVDKLDSRAICQDAASYGGCFIRQLGKLVIIIHYLAYFYRILLNLQAGGEELGGDATPGGINGTY